LAKPIIFSDDRKRNRRCMICRDDELSLWIRDCIEMTIGAGEKRPSMLVVHESLKSSFPDRSPAHENSTRRHLLEHEPAWGRWDG